MPPLSLRKVVQALELEAERTPALAGTIRMLQVELIDLGNDRREALIYFRSVGNATWRFSLIKGRLKNFVCDD